LRQHRQHRLHVWCLFSDPSNDGLIAPRPITAGSADNADGTDGIFSSRAHLDHLGSCPAFTSERDIDTQRPEERLRPPQSTGERPRIFCPCYAGARMGAALGSISAWSSLERTVFAEPCSPDIAISG
jgi:hypothetical protein